jgi:hypothetical protein
VQPPTPQGRKGGRKKGREGGIQEKKERVLPTNLLYLAIRKVLQNLIKSSSEFPQNSDHTGFMG